MGKQMRNALTILACSLLILALSGCSLTLGPVIEKRAIIIHSGVPIEIVQQIKVDCRVLKDKEESDIFKQDVGGWVAMHPDHWNTLKKDHERLKKLEKKDDQ